MPSLADAGQATSTSHLLGALHRSSRQGGVCGGVKESQQSPTALQPLSTPTTITTAATPTIPHTPHRPSIFSHLRFNSLSCGVVSAVCSFPSLCYVCSTRPENILFSSHLVWCILMQSILSYNWNTGHKVNLSAYNPFVKSFVLLSIIQNLCIPRAAN